ncbi:MAG: hypothetical protein VB064_05940 [Oscillospiraceae bacterium]|nr:hypothetical protein [Oscillospiraceae bacterium]
MKAFVIVVLILTVLMLTPFGIDGGYGGGKLVLGIRIGFLNLRIIPGRLTREKPAAPRKTVKKKKSGAGGKLKEKAPLDKKELVRIVKIGLKALGRLRRKLHVDYLRIHYTFASDDPFKTAAGFGYSSAALGAIMPLVEDAFIIGERDIGTSLDFLGDKPVFDCWITLKIQVWELLYIAAAFGIDYLILRLRLGKKDRIRKE